MPATGWQEQEGSFGRGARAQAKGRAGKPGDQERPHENTMKRAELLETNQVGNVQKKQKTIKSKLMTCWKAHGLGKEECFPWPHFLLQTVQNHKKRQGGSIPTTVVQGPADGSLLRGSRRGWHGTPGPPSVCSDGHLSHLSPGCMSHVPRALTFETGRRPGLWPLAL